VAAACKVYYGMVVYKRAKEVQHRTTTVLTTILKVYTTAIMSTVLYRYRYVKRLKNVKKKLEIIFENA
jgi:hypothetical protein